MIKLEQLQPGAAVRGIVPDALVVVVSVQWFGSEALELTYKTPPGKVANELLYRHDEPRLDLVEQGRPWGFDGDGSLFRLVSEAQRIRLAHLFDPVLAVHTSVVNPLPHQITAVYESMLPRQPLRFLLADDPGAGKTIMAGLLIKEAQKMSATVFGGEIKYTKRYRLGQLLSTLTRHFLLMTATPHNGKEADFQLFMALLDGDRFEGRFRDGVHVTDASDLMRRMVKESLARKALGGHVFDVLGKLQFAGRSLRDLLIEAIRYGDQPDVRARLTTVLDHALDRGHLRDLLEERALAHDAMDVSRVCRIREDMERAEARRLQPHYIESFFHEAFQRLGGSAKQREPRRYEVTHVPAPVRNRDRLIGIGEPVLPRYERIAFEKSLVAPHGQPLAAFVCPGHPLLDSVIDLTLERHRDLLKRGAVLVDERDAGTWPRVLFYIEHTIQDASLTRSGERRVVSRRMLYVELDAGGTTRHVHYAPYLDYRPLAKGEPGVDAILDRPECAWIDREIEKKAQGYAVAQVVPEHLKEVRDSKLKLIAKTEAAVKDRLTKEITYWDHRAEQLKLQEKAGRPNAKLNSGEARKRADNLQGRLQKRLEELKLEAQISPLPPVVLGGLLVVPLGLIAAMTGRSTASPSAPVDTQASAARARAVVMAIERNLGFEPADHEFEKLGYDVESRVPGTGKLRFIEVKGRITGATTITVTRNEILYSLNKPDDFILAIVEFREGDSHRVHYIRQPFPREPDFGVTSVNYGFAELLARAAEPS